MLEFQEKKKIRQFLYSRPTLVIIAVIFVISVNATYRMYQKASETGANRDVAAREEAALAAKKKELESQLSQLKTSRGMEEEIRKKFRVVKEGEGIVIVVDNTKKAAEAAPAEPNFRSLFDRIRNLFK